MRIAGIANLLMALVWVPIAVFEPYEGDGLVGFFRIFNAVVFSAFTVVWIALEVVRYRARKKNGQHQTISPTGARAAP
ncbi:hypothetical protein A6A08_22465 [Nocardiopsis sp. TSRI0078]|uniref:hypothetical protein n=1 Tax=unclassified Nocardiopsis TaxID=2649073 RepID=UPI00093FD2F3|nr:hypothetical protein [Nocardiopsis sp. TSRI0078]OKI20742.1 hypothetical protein A6A08_22465 [Nocardiopsis sp. TSRI0078]